jgi:hypothetical protein
LCYSALPWQGGAPPAKEAIKTTRAERRHGKEDPTKAGSEEKAFSPMCVYICMYVYIT